MSSPVLVRHIMSTKVVTFFEEQTIPLADDVMRIHHFRHLPVIDTARHLIGLVSQRDILRGQISVLTGLTEAERRARQEQIQIRHLMTRDVWTVTPETLASHAGQTLIDHDFSCLPVVDEHHVLCGIVTERDFLRFAIKAFQIND
jgi:CBS-domain-containing membrane protein